jgi:radical SAM superfamily enzyme YgiQ (UPF0313 family)
MNVTENKGYRRVLFCIPPFEFNARIENAGRITRAPCMPSPGIGYLSEMLTTHGIQNWVFDFRLGYSMSDLLSWINKIKPDLVGVTMTTYRHDLAYEIVSRIKSSKYDIVVGGPHVSLFGSKVLEGCEANFAIKFEGEYPLLELCQGKDLDEIKGLIYRNGPKIVENEDRPFIKNLDELPFPRYRKFELSKYTDVRPIISSRGCPYQCIFCTTGSMGKIFRVRSAENVVNELEYWYKAGYRVFDFLDDNFTLIKDRVYEICNLIKQRGLTGLELHCSNGVRADRVDKDLLKTMKEVGFNYICFGVEAGNNRILKTIKKGVTIERIEKAIKDAVEMDYDVGLFFMVGHPGETVKDIEDSIKLALKYPVALAKFLNIIPYPGTELFQWIKKNNYFVGDWYKKLNYAMHLDEEPFFETPELPLAVRKRMLEKTAQVWKEVKKRYVKNKLAKKYGPFGRVLGDLLYLRFLYSYLWKSYNNNETLRKLIDATMNLMGLKIVHF